MNLRPSLLVLLLCSLLSASAQQYSETAYLQALSMETAVNRSMENAPILRIRQLKQKQSELAVSKSRIDRIPNLFGSADMRHNLIVQSTPIPASMLNPNASVDDVMYMKFGTPWTSGVGLNLNFDIFNPETAGQTSELKHQATINGLDTRLEQIELRTGVQQAYMECAIAYEQLETITADTLYYHQMLLQAIELYGKQKIALTEYNNATMARNNSLVRYWQAYNIRQNACTNLLQLMGEQPTVENIAKLRLSENIQTLYTRLMKPSESDLVLLPHSTTDELRQQELISLATNRLKNTTLKYFPTLSLSGFYGTNYFGNNLQFFNTIRWFGNSYVALSLRVPISRLLSATKEVQQQQLSEQIENENLRNLHIQRTQRWNNTMAQLQLLQNEYLVKSENLQLTHQNLIATQANYQKGYSLYTDLAAEQLNYQNATQQYLQAAYDVLTCKIQIEKLKE